MALNSTDLLLVEQQVQSEGPNQGVAYALWFLLWFVSGHRFYLGRPGTAILQILSYFVLIGFIWWLIDAFTIPSMIQQDRQKIRTRLTATMASATGR